ncbi:MAG: hypothetical protein OEX19_14950 [Gammaproteobacteria bacterium]|nr:hypothetical protein [Gammaproteobacteria bacterium]
MGTAHNIHTLDEQTRQLIETVRYNCDIADAQNAQENTMCIYLLKMRDYFGWSNSLPLNASIPKDKLGKWINEKEKRWESIYQNEFAPICIDGIELDAFDTNSINNTLVSRGLLYSAGIGRGGQVHFHLGVEIPFLTDRTKNIYVTSFEYARDLTASPAHSIGGAIFLRKEALQRYIWEKYEEWKWKKPDNAMAKVLNFYPFETDPMRAVNQMSANEIATTLLHEKGELEAGNILGPQWEEMLMTLSGSRAEILARATRDHLADCLITLPTLIKEENWPAIHFYFANFEGFRKIIWPELIDIYNNTVANHSLDSLHNYIINEAQPYWLIHSKNLLQKIKLPNLKLHKEISTYFERAIGV